MITSHPLDTQLWPMATHLLHRLDGQLHVVTDGCHCPEWLAVRQCNERHPI